MRMPLAALPVLVVTAALTGCTDGAAPAAPAAVDRPAGELTARTTVLDSGDGARLCLSGVGQSLPPVCGMGPAVAGWDWSQVEGEESQVGVTWGDYEVFGTWDGTVFTLTRTPDPVDLRAPSTASPVPEPTPGEPADRATVDRAIADYTAEMGTPTGPLGVGEYAGRASIGVIHDDGTQQAEADARYGKDVVEVYSALRPATAG